MGGWKTSWRGGKREREGETEGKAEMKWGEAWLVRGVPPRHSLLINQPPTTLSREPIFLLRTYHPPRSLSLGRSFCCILVSFFFSVTRLPCRYPTRTNSIIGYFNQGNRLTSPGHA